VALRVAGDADRARPVAVVADDRQQFRGRRVRAVRRCRVATDQEQVLDAGVGHRAQQRVEMRAVAHHPRGHVRGDRVPARAQPAADVDALVRAVTRRARDRQLQRLVDPRRLGLRPLEWEDLELRDVAPWRRAVAHTGCL
jgi:hypothetical protein